MVRVGVRGLNIAICFLAPPSDDAQRITRMLREQDETPRSKDRSATSDGMLIYIRVWADFFMLWGHLNCASSCVQLVIDIDSLHVFLFDAAILKHKILSG